MHRLVVCGLLAASMAGCAMIPEPNDQWPRVEAVSPGMIQNQPLREYQVDVVDLLATALCSPGAYDVGSPPRGCDTISTAAFVETRPHAELTRTTNDALRALDRSIQTASRPAEIAALGSARRALADAVRSGPAARRRAVAAIDAAVSEIDSQQTATLTALAAARGALVAHGESRPADIRRDQRRGEYSLYARYIALADMSRNERARNSVASQLVAASVHNCNIYMQSLRGGQVGARTTADLATSTFGVAGAVIEPLSTARTLSSLAALSTAWGASWDRNVYADQAAEMVADEIRKLRLTERAALEAKYALPYDEWPMAAALADVAEFHNSCTMLRGISLIQDAVINRERSVRATRIAAQSALDAGGDGRAVMAAVNGVAQAFLGTSDFDAGLPLLTSSGLAIGVRDLEPAMARGRDCLAQLTNADGARRDDRAIGTIAECQTPAGHVWHDQFIAIVVTEHGNTESPGTFHPRAVAALQERRAAIEAGRALYADTLSRGVSLEWNWEMIQGTLDALTSTGPVDPDVDYGPAMMSRDPIILAMRRSYEGSLQDGGDRTFSLRGAVAIAQALANHPASPPSPPEPGQEGAVQPETEPADTTPEASGSDSDDQT